MGRRIKPLIFGVLMAILITAIGLFFLAFILYKTNRSEGFAVVAVALIYLIASFCGGYVAGRKAGQRKYLWGLLVGTGYLGSLFLLSFLMKQDAAAFFAGNEKRIILSLVGGMLGGMFS